MLGVSGAGSVPDSGAQGPLADQLGRKDGEMTQRLGRKTERRGLSVSCCNKVRSAKGPLAKWWGAPGPGTAGRGQGARG